MPDNMPQEQSAQNENELKKKRKRDLIISAIIIILLLLLVGIWILITYNKAADPDIAIVKRLNSVVATYEDTNGESKNVNDALVNSDACGFILDNLVFTKDTRFVAWDSKNNCYILFDGSDILYSPTKNSSSGTDLWIFVKEIPTSSKYSVYCRGTCETKEAVTYADGTTEEITVFHGDHIYETTVNGDSQTYNCTEDGCNYSYTIKITK